MTNVFEGLIGQEALAGDLIAAARAARGVAAELDHAAAGAVSMFGEEVPPPSGGSVMTHSWLFTGPAGSGRSVAATSFAAALQCTDPDTVGCGECRACTTILAGTHGDVRHIVPEGLTISVRQIRDIVQLAARRPTTGRWQIVIVEDADRLTEQGSNALLKAVEEPPDRTLFLLCAPSVAPEDISVTLRSRCRHMALTAPSPAAVAQVLIRRDGIDPDRATWAAGVCGGHIGRARRLATDEKSRSQREQALALASAAVREGEMFGAGEALVASAKKFADEIAAELNEPELAELRTALGAGGTGKGTARAPRGSAGAIKDLEKRQKARHTRIMRDTLDRALVDLAALFRDALALSTGASVTMMHPDKTSDVSARMAGYAAPEHLLGCVEAVLECREALERNVKPKFAMDALMVRLGGHLSSRSRPA
ncbi:MAG: DNA polymerase III subunit delta' [Gordonia sp. (in: high G+C Gram-positive bacteria)]|uniref:DNA polymerase III subunit delta' n=1 Tax=Gordonia sp. (in: high G+C Gram-positive bacteria) TaxID=84139 RepID=UPI0039E6BD2A